VEDGDGHLQRLTCIRCACLTFLKSASLVALGGFAPCREGTPQERFAVCSRGLRPRRRGPPVAIAQLPARAPVVRVDLGIGRPYPRSRDKGGRPMLINNPAPYGAGFESRA
jgi:hypothetical protein